MARAQASTEGGRRQREVVSQVVVRSGRAAMRTHEGEAPKATVQVSQQGREQVAALDRARTHESFAHSSCAVATNAFMAAILRRAWSRFAIAAVRLAAVDYPTIQSPRFNPVQVPR